MSLTPYLMTVALHAGIISLLGLIAVPFIPHPRGKSTLIAACLVATGLFSWFSPLLPSRTVAAAMTKPAVEPPIVSLEVLPVVRVPIAAEIQAPPMESQATKVEPARRIQPGDALLLLWATGSIVGAAFLLRSLISVKRWSESLLPPTNREWESVLEASPDMQDRHRFRISPDPISPGLAGIIRPAIILPRHLLTSAQRNQLRWALTHEIAHRDAHDSRWTLLLSLTRVLFWWNPIVHALHHAWEDARERDCDLSAAPTAVERPDYGSFLLSVAAAPRHRPPLATSMASTRHGRRLKKRISALLESPADRLRPPTRLHLAGCLLFGLLALGTASRFGFLHMSPLSTAAAAAPELEPILNPQKKIAVSMAFLISPEPFAKDGEILSAAGLETRVHANRKDPRFHLQAAPVVALNSKEVFWTHHTHLSRYDSSDPEIPWDGLKVLIPFSGWVVAQDYRLNGDTIEASLRGAYSFEPGIHPPSGFPVLTPSTLAKFQGKGSIKAGNAICFSFGEVEPGVHASLVVGLTAIDPWDAVELDKSTFFPAITQRLPERKAPAPTIVSIFAPGPLNEEQLLLSKAATEAAEELNAARENHPDNAAMVAHRDILRQVIDKHPESREAHWKIERIEKAIIGNVEEDPAIIALAKKHRVAVHAFVQATPMQPQPLMPNWTLDDLKRLKEK